MTANTGHKLEFATDNNTTAMTIDSSQNVGIGVVSPSASLHINTTDDGSVFLTRDGGHSYSLEHDTSQLYLYNRTISKSVLEFEHSGPVVINEQGHSTVDFRVEGDTDANLLFTDASTDRVGIGTNSPLAKLHINNGTTGVASLDFEDVSQCAIFVPAVQTTNYFQPLIGVGENATTFTAAISSYDAGGSAAQGLAFHTGNTNAITEAMRIDASQNVGIGTNSPSEKLHIVGNVRVHDGGYLAAGDSNDIFIRHDGSGTLQSNTGEMYINNVANTNLFFQTNNTERLRIDNQGNLRFADNGTNPTAVINTAFMFNDGGELKVLDEAGNTTTISPHNFDLIPGGASEDRAWGYYSEKDIVDNEGNVTATQKVNVDMMKLARLVEELTGEKLVYTEED